MIRGNMLHLIVNNKWQTPNHSKERQSDDTHEVKKEILKAVGRRLYEKEVGKNPDIDIDRENRIVLKSVEKKFKRKPCYITKLKAEDFFILRFSVTHNLVEIEYLELPHKEQITINFMHYYQHAYILPQNIDLVLHTLDIVIDNIFDMEIQDGYFIFIMK